MMHLTSVSYIITRTVLVRRPRVIRTRGYAALVSTRAVHSRAHLAAPSRTITLGLRKNHQSRAR